MTGIQLRETTSVIKAAFKAGVQNCMVAPSEHSSCGVKTFNEQKLVACMLGNSVNGRNPIVKSKICMAFAILFAKGARLKEIEQVVKLLGSYASDASPSVRDGARRAFQALQEHNPDFDEILERYR